MERLSEHLFEGVATKGFGLVVFGELASFTLQEEAFGEVKDLMEKLCPENILMNGEWRSEGFTATIDEKKKCSCYAYYAPEYLQGKPWTPACTSFAIFSIAYRIITGKLPYIGAVPDELFYSKDSIAYIKKCRKENILDITDIPPSFQNFFIKGLSLKKKDRYQEIGDTADEFSELCNNTNGSEMVKEAPIVPPTREEPTQTEIEKIMAQSSTSDFFLEVHTDKRGSLDDLVGLENLKEYFRKSVLAIIKNPEKAKKYKLSIPNGLLLYGPPGCGKTACAKKFAAESRMNYAVINAQDIASTWVHGTQKIVRQLFSQAEIFAPIILIFDEIETMVPDRKHPDNIKVAEDTNAFLSELNTCAERGIFVVGTTNRPQFMDSAILRSGRFDKKIYVPLPDEETRAMIFKNYLHGRPIDKHIDYQALGQMTSSGYISSDIQQICNEVATRAFNDDAIITQSLIEQVIKDGSPSVSRNELRSYEEARRYLEPAAKCGSYINQIGFR